MKNNKTKRIISIVLSVIMLLAVCPSVSYAVGFEYPENMTGKPDNSDEIILAYAASHGHADAQPLTISKGYLEEGSYYLANDVALTGNIYIYDKVNLCLNGHVLDLNGENSIVVSGEDAVLNIYDCNSSVVHRFSKMTEGYWELDEANGDIEVAGGVITGFNATATEDNKNPKAINVANGALNIYKANIVGNRIYEGGSIINAGNAELNIYSAKLSYNYAGASTPFAARALVNCENESNAFLGKNVEIKNNYFKVYDHKTSISSMLRNDSSTTSSYAKMENNTACVIYHNFASTLYINGLTCNNTSSGTYTYDKGTTYINGNFEDNIAGSFGGTNDYIIAGQTGASVYLNGKVTGNKAFFIAHIQQPDSVLYLNGEITGNTSYNRTVNVTTGSTLCLLSGTLIGDNILEDYSDPSYVATDILMRNVGSFVTISEMPTSNFEIKFQKGHPNRYISVAEGLDLEEVLTHLIWDKTQLDYVINEEESRIYIYDHVHDVLITPQVDATCTTDGTTERRVCTKCDAVLLESTVIPATGHPDENIIANYGYRAATCENKGYTGDLFCTKCNTVITPGQEIDATGHRYTKIVGYKAATHFEEGYTGDVYCEICDGFGYYGNVIPKLKGEGIEHADEKINETGEPGHDHLCDGCGEKISECVDEDKNHFCDLCGVELSKHYDRTADHLCDLCGYKMSECEDNDNSHYCDLCGTKLTDHDFVYDSTVAATCTTEGYDIYKCYCGATQTQTIPATGHTEKTVDKVEPTCESTGWTAYTICSVCGVTLDDGGHIIAALNHPQEKRELKGEKAASCTETGYTGDVVCNLCGGTVIPGSTIDKTPHTRDEVRGYKAATHLEAGYTGDVYCKCGELVEKGEVIDPENHVDEKINETDIDGHDHLCDTCGTKISQCIDVKNGAGEEGKDHLCDICKVRLSDCADESNNHFCDICGELLTKEHIDENNDKECDTCGIKMGGPKGVCYDSENDGDHRCDYCNNLLTDEFVCADNDNDHYCDDCHTKLSDHDYDTAETAATCTTGAYVTYTCKVCGYTYNTEPGEPLGHDYVTTINKAATCTEDGSATVTCSRCDYNEVQTLSAKGHTPAPAVIENVIEATCTAKGSYDEVIYCSECSAELNRNTIITGYAEHKYVVDEVVEPTCEEGGYTKYICTECGETKIEQLPPTGHHDADDDGLCDKCGKELRHVDNNDDGICDHCGVHATKDGKWCKWCSKYYRMKDIEFVGIFIKLIHSIVHAFTAIDITYWVENFG